MCASWWSFSRICTFIDRHVCRILGSKTTSSIQTQLLYTTAVCLYEYYLSGGLCHRQSVISCQSPPPSNLHVSVLIEITSECEVCTRTAHHQAVYAASSSITLITAAGPCSFIHLIPRMQWVLSATSSRLSVFRIVTQTRLDFQGIVGWIPGRGKKYSDTSANEDNSFRNHIR